MDEIRGVRVWRRKTKRKKKKKAEGEERIVYLDEKKKDNGKNKIKNNKKLNLRNVTIIFLQ